MFSFSLKKIFISDMRNPLSLPVRAAVCIAAIIALSATGFVPAHADSSGNAGSIADKSTQASLKASSFGIKAAKAKKNVSGVRVTKKEIDKYMGKSGFIGSSTSVGLRMYFNTKSKNYLGRPTMMMRTSYSFANDRISNHGFMIKYKGRELKARTAVKRSRIKRAFICMGTNDLGAGAARSTKNYKAYLAGIRNDNPNVIIFIEACTPMRGSKGALNNKNIRKFNKNMKKWSASQKDIFFIDIASPLTDSSGQMRAYYSSDNYVHLTMAGYKVWTDTVVKDVRALLLNEKRADVAVKAAESTLNRTDYRYAKKLVAKLEKSTVKTKLNKRLQKAYKRMKKAEAKKKAAEKKAAGSNLQNKQEQEGTGQQNI